MSGKNSKGAAMSDPKLLPSSPASSSSALTIWCADGLTGGEPATAPPVRLVLTESRKLSMDTYEFGMTAGLVVASLRLSLRDCPPSGESMPSTPPPTRCGVDTCCTSAIYCGGEERVRHGAAAAASLSV